MTPQKTATAFRIDPDILDGLRLVKERDGMPFSEQVRRALRNWLELKGVTKTARKRASTRSQA